MEIAYWYYLTTIVFLTAPIHITVVKKIAFIIFTIMMTSQLASACVYVVPLEGFKIIGVHSEPIPGFYRLDLVGRKIISNDVYLDLFHKAIVGSEGVKGNASDHAVSAYSSIINFTVTEHNFQNYTVIIPHTTTANTTIPIIATNRLLPYTTNQQLHDEFVVFFSQKYDNYYVLYGRQETEYVVYSENLENITHQAKSPSISSYSSFTIYDKENIIQASFSYSDCGPAVQQFMYNESSIYTTPLSSATWDNRLSLFLTIQGVYSTDTENTIDHYLVQYYNYSSQVYENYTLPGNTFDKYLEGPIVDSILPYVLGVVLVIGIAIFLIYRKRNKFD